VAGCPGPCRSCGARARWRLDLIGTAVGAAAGGPHRLALPDGGVGARPARAALPSTAHPDRARHRPRRRRVARALLGGRALKAVHLGVPPMTSVLLGVITGIGGGVLRDVLVNRKPVVLTQEIYVLPALLGSLVPCSAPSCGSSRCDAAGAARCPLAPTALRNRCAHPPSAASRDTGEETTRPSSFRAPTRQAAPSVSRYDKVMVKLRPTGERSRRRSAGSSLSVLDAVDRRRSQE
jgi:hypothetical protein